MNARSLKGALLGFWAVWYTAVCGANVFDALKSWNALPAEWPLASGNFQAIEETTARYGFPFLFNVGLFVAAIIWQGVAAYLFWRLTAEASTQPVREAPSLYPAFTVSLLLWAAFCVVDELMIRYDVETTHLRLFIAQLLTLITVVLIPDEPQPRK